MFPEFFQNFNQERKTSLNIKFLGGISRGRPGGYPPPKMFTPSLEEQENEGVCADVLDPKARTSMTQGDLRKTLCRKTSFRSLLKREFS